MSSDPAPVTRIPSAAEHERDYVLRMQQERAEHRRKVRHYAVQDVASGMSLVSAAVVWGVLRSELEQWIDEDTAGD